MLMYTINIFVEKSEIFCKTKYFHIFQENSSIFDYVVGIHLKLNEEISLRHHKANDIISKTCQCHTAIFKGCKNDNF